MLKKFTLFLFISLLLNVIQSFAVYPQTDTRFLIASTILQSKIQTKLTCREYYGRNGSMYMARVFYMSITIARHSIHFALRIIY